jgi:hypothetical protein
MLTVLFFFFNFILVSFSQLSNTAHLSLASFFFFFLVIEKVISMQPIYILVNIILRLVPEKIEKDDIYSFLNKKGV